MQTLIHLAQNRVQLYTLPNATFKLSICHKIHEIPRRAERLLASHEIICSLKSMFLLRLGTINREMLFNIKIQRDLQICESYLSTNPLQATFIAHFAMRSGVWFITQENCPDLESENNSVYTLRKITRSEMTSHLPCFALPHHLN